MRMDAAKITISDFRPGDGAVFRQLYREWFISCFRQPPEPVDEPALNEPEKAIVKKGGAILVALEDGEVAGFVALKIAGASEMELTKMIVRPQSRGKGLGEILCRAILERAATLGATSVVLYSHRSLEAALALYRKLGFQEVALEQGLYSSFRCNIKMQKSLASAEQSA